jgi:hypothetical protein
MMSNWDWWDKIAAACAVMGPTMALYAIGSTLTRIERILTDIKERSP